MIPRPRASTRRSRPGARALHWLFPDHCFGCGGCGQGAWCPRCRSDAVPIEAPLCEVCGYPGVLGVCSRCTANRPAFDRARSSVIYDGSVRRLIGAFKYRGYRGLAGDLVALLDENLAEARSMGGDLVTAVPSDPLRQWRRGFNPAALVAGLAAARVGLESDFGLVRRRMGWHAQVGLDLEARRKGVEGRFYLNRNADFAGRDLILIDDVFTTGSTCSEVAAVLKSGGAPRVQVVTAVREELQSGLRPASGGRP